MADELTTAPPVFLRNQDIVDGDTRSSPQAGPTPYEVCVTVSRIIGPGTVEGAQSPDSQRGCWRIYMKSPHSRVQLLARREIRLGGKCIPLYDTNPSASGQNSPDDLREKITIKYLPLSVSNTEIQSFFVQKGVKLTSPIQYSRARDPDGRLTDYKNGDRYCYAQAPIQPKLQRLARIAGIHCRMFHNGQFSNDCKACNQPGHKIGDISCPALNNEDNITTFRSYNMVLSNMHASTITVFGEDFKSVEHAYQWKKALDIGAKTMADKIKNAQHAGVAKQLSKDLPKEQVDQWAETKSEEIMTALIRHKSRQVPAFKAALLDTNPVIAEATYDKVWGTGLSPEHTKCTKPEYWPGGNLLGAIMQEIRQEIQVDQVIEAPQSTEPHPNPADSTLRQPRQKSPTHRVSAHRSSSTGSFSRRHEEPISRFFTPHPDRSKRQASTTPPSDRSHKAQRQEPP